MSLVGIDRLYEVLHKSKAKKEAETNLRITFIKVMQTVGGYEQMMNLPIPLFVEIVNGLNDIDKQEASKFNIPKPKR